MRKASTINFSILYLFIFYLSLIGINIAYAFENENEFVEYAFKSLRKENENEYLKYFAYYYFEMDNMDKTFSILNKMNDADKYFVIKKVLNTEVKHDADVLNKLKIYINSIEGINEKVELYQLLAIAYYKIGENKISKEIFLVTYNIIRSERDTIFRDPNLISLSFNLIITENYQDAFKILNELEKRESGYENIFDRHMLIQNIINQYILLKKDKKVEENIDKLKILSLRDDIELRDKVTILYNLGKCYFYFNKFDIAKNYFIKAFKMNDKLKDEHIKYSNFNNFLNIHENELIVSFISNIEEIEKIIEKNLMYRNNKRKQLETAGFDNKIIIDFFVQEGKYNKAQDIAANIDKIGGGSENMDYYYYVFVVKLLKSRPLFYNPIYFAEKVTHENIKFDLILKILREYFYIKEYEEFFMVLELLEKNANKRNNFPVGQLVMTLIDFGYLDRAINIIEFEEEDCKALLLYEIIQAYLIEYNIEAAKKIILKIPNNSVFKGLAISKLASVNYCVDEKQNALRLFKNSTESIKKSRCKEELGLDYEYFISNEILIDYLYAKKYKKFLKTDWWIKSQSIN